MRYSVARSRTARIVVETLFTLLTIPLGLGYVESAFFRFDAELELRAILCMVFSCMAIVSLLRAWRWKADGRPKANCVLKLIHAGLFLICGLLPLFFGFTLDACELPMEEMKLGFFGDVRQIVGPIYWGMLFSGRVLSIIQNHRWYRVLLNLVLLAVIALLAFYSVISPATYAVMFTQAILSLGSIMAVTFARVRLDVLKKIIRKTYAAEIIFGLLLLIVSFSYVFKYMEESINTFADGLWYCFAIVTTIGFGDFTATSIVGRVLSVILGIYGIIVVALITSIIVNFYGEMKKTGDDGEGERAAIEEAGNREAEDE